MKLKEFKKPKTHTVVKRTRGRYYLVEWFCTSCQKYVDEPNKRCKGAK